METTDEPLLRALPPRAQMRRETLKRRGFVGVTMKPKGCTAGETYLLTLKRQAEAVDDARFKPKGSTWEKGELSLRTGQAGVALMKGKDVLCTVAVPKDDGLPFTAAISPSQKLFYLIEQGEYGAVLRGLCGGSPLKALPLAR